MRGFVEIAEHQRVCRERDELRGEVAYLRASTMLTPEQAAYVAIKQRYPRMERATICVVWRLYTARSGALSYDALYEALPGRGGDGSDALLKIVGVYVSQARASFGREAIENVWGFGYRLTRKGAAAIDAALEPERRRA